MEGPEIKFAEAVLDNGKFGTRTVRFETGRLASRRRAPSPPTSTRKPCCCRPPAPASTRKDNFDFFPLTVDVEERSYAAGKIPGSFFRREGRPSTEAILVCRLIDRPLRPSFVDGPPQRGPDRHHRAVDRAGRVLRRARHQRRVRCRPRSPVCRSPARSAASASRSSRSARRPVGRVPDRTRSSKRPSSTSSSPAASSPTPTATKTSRS